MGGFIKELNVRADVATLARALSGEPGLAILASDPRGALAAADARFSFLAARPIAESSAWAPACDAADSPSAGWAGFPAAPRWIGAIPYEAGRHVERAGWVRAPDPRPRPRFTAPRWLRYDAVLRVDHVTGIVAIEADDRNAAARLEARLTAFVPSREAATFSFKLTGDPPDFDAPADASDGERGHEARVRAVLELIARGDVYQVNLARRIACRATGDLVELFLALRTAAPAPYGFFADLGDLTVSASSPELALEARGASLRTAPIKGTRPRGADAPADLALARELDADPKERAELTMAVDLHRNDLGRVAEIGSVRVLGPPRVVAGRTVLSRVAEVRARRRAGVTNDALARAMIPCGSVTGAPKVRAMEIIASLEPARRGLYTGAFGYVGRDDALVLAVAIRTLEVGLDGAAHYWTGGGIVSDSVPERELDETRWKATQLGALETWPNVTNSISGRQPA